ncbi:U4/U6 small nuclear ribonucleoprotein prp4 [Sorochytrium milnesiophthora]
MAGHSQTLYSCSPRRANGNAAAKHLAAQPSQSSPSSAAGATAAAAVTGTPAVEPEASLDHVLTPEEIEQAEQRLIEERRRRRQAILEKHKSQASDMGTDSDRASSHKVPDPAPATHTGSEQRWPSVLMQSRSSTPSLSPMPPSPAHSGPADDESSLLLALGKHTGDGHQQQPGEENEISAADYNPTADGLAEDARHANKTATDAISTLLRNKDAHERVVSHQTTTGNGDESDMFAADYQETGVVPQHGAEVEQPAAALAAVAVATASDDIDMFAAVDDIFAEQPALSAAKAIPGSAVVAHLAHADNWDDSEGYYRVVIGEMLEQRYRVLSILGKGVFSTVVRAMDTQEHKEVAIKFIRHNETMYKAGVKELGILKRLMEADRGNKKHLIRLYRHFEHRNHLCLVFESLSMNLREVLKRYGGNVGLNIKAVRVYTYQLLQALSLLRSCGILHADLKPDNILVTESRNVLKLCDLGSASDASENDITPYLVSRFYRAPEIILGLSYDYGIDMWSMACTLYELYTGKILFPGRSNNQMLKLHMELKGRIPARMLKRGKLVSKHFDEEHWDFISVELDKLTGQDTARSMQFSKPVKDMRARLAADINTDTEEGLLVAHFADFLDKALTLNPEKRMDVRDALRHPFIHTSHAK